MCNRNEASMVNDSVNRLLLNCQGNIIRFFKAQFTKIYYENNLSEKYAFPFDELQD